MGFNKFGVFVSGLALSMPSFAAVTIIAPEEIVLVAVNDQEVNTGLFRKAANNYQVDAGSVSLSMRYKQYFKHLDGEHDIVKSGIVTLQAENLVDGQRYSLKPINVPRDYEAAQKYAEQPTIALYDQKNQLVVQQTGANSEDKPWFSGRMFDFTSAKRTSGQQPAAVYASQTIPITSTSVSSTVPSTTTQAGVVVPQVNQADQQLIQIWQGASKAERQRFMSWLANQ